MQKMSITALQGEAIGQIRKTLDCGDDGYINSGDIQPPQGFLPLPVVMGIVNEVLQFCIGFQWYGT